MPVSYQGRFARVRGLIVGSAILIGGVVGSVSAAIIDYTPPPLVGTNVTYTSVSESSNTDALPLFGTPTVSGNNLVFNNLNFNANSINGGPPIDFTDGQINFTIQANAGTFLNQIRLSEFGDYNVSATPGSGSNNFVKVFPQALQITVLDVNGTTLGVPLVDNTSAVMTFSPSGGDYQTNVDPATGSWQGLAIANLSALFGSNQITRISVSFDNQLLAQSQQGGIASISKKGVIVSPNVPEPMMAGVVSLLAALGFARVRRSESN